MSAWLLIGIGNPLRGDDAFGMRLVAACRGLFPNLAVLHLQQLAPEYVTEFSGRTGVIFADARVGENLGLLSCLPVSSDAAVMVFSHAQGPGSLVKLAELLNGQRPACFSLTVESMNFDLGLGLSPEVEAALPAAIRAVEELIANNSGCTRADAIPMQSLAEVGRVSGLA